MSIQNHQHWSYLFLEVVQARCKKGPLCSIFRIRYSSSAIMYIMHVAADSSLKSGPGDFLVVDSGSRFQCSPKIADKTQSTTFSSTGLPPPRSAEILLMEVTSFLLQDNHGTRFTVRPSSYGSQLTSIHGHDLMASRVFFSLLCRALS